MRKLQTIRFIVSVTVATLALQFLVPLKPALAASSYSLLASTRPPSGTSGLRQIGTPQFYNGSLVFNTYDPSALRAYTNSIDPASGGNYVVSTPELTGDYANDPNNAAQIRKLAAAPQGSNGTDNAALVVNQGGNYLVSIQTDIATYSSDPQYDLSDNCLPGNGGADPTAYATMGDIDHDGFTDILAGNNCGLYLMDQRGGIAHPNLFQPSTIKAQPDTHFVKAPVLGDFNGDSYTDVLVTGQYRTTSNGTDNYYLEALNGSGTKLWELALNQEVPSQPIAADVDGDGHDEVVLCTDQKLRVLNYDGTLKWQSATPCYQPTVTNLDSDSGLEIVYHTVSGSDAVISAVNGSDGSGVSGYPFTITNATVRNTPISLKLSAADTTNDLLIPTSRGLLAFRGSDHQALWTLNAGESAEYAAAWVENGRMVLAYEGTHNYTDDYVTELYALKDGASDLSFDQQDIFPMDGATPQQTYNFDSVPLSQPDGGYNLVASDGGVFPFGQGEGHGSTGNIKLRQPIVGMSKTPGGHGYWLVAADGGIFPFGDAVGYGSTGNLRLFQPMVGMARTATGHGYWLVAADGGIFPFGDAVGYGSTGNVHLRKPIVGMAATPSGHGYWLVAADGGIFTYGDAKYYGSTGDIRLFKPIVGMAN